MATERANCWNWHGPVSGFMLTFEKNLNAVYKVHEVPAKFDAATFRKEVVKPYRTAYQTFMELHGWLIDPLRKGEFFLHVWGNTADSLAIIDCHLDDPNTAFEFKIRWC